MQLKPIHNDILFVFADKVNSNSFVNTTSWGLEIINPVEDIKHTRWGKVTHIGPDITIDVKIGDYILIEPLMWTNRFEFEGNTFWKTNDYKVLAVSTITKGSTIF